MNSSKSICYIGNNPDALQFVRSSLKNKDSLIKLKDLKQLEIINYLLIISPAKVDLGGTFFRWVDVSCLWENYLLEHYPHIRLMIVGFWSCDRMNCSNYQDILDLDSLQDNLLPSSFPILEEVYAEKEIEADRLSEWDIKRYLKRFADGHDQQGFFKYLTALKHTLTLAYDEYNAAYDEYKWNYETIEKNIIRASGMEEWKHLLERWAFYKPFLSHTHFRQHIDTISSSIEGMKKYFSSLLKKSTDSAENEKLFVSGNFEQQLEKIDDLLSHHLTPYL